MKPQAVSPWNIVEMVSDKLLLAVIVSFTFVSQSCELIKRWTRKGNFQLFLSFSAVSAFEPGLKSITIYTHLKSKTGSEHLSLLLDNQAFEKLLANKEIVKSPKQLQNTFDFLNLLDGRCDVQLKCNKKVEECDKEKTCKACPSCKMCKDCDKCDKTTTTTTTKPPPPTPKVGKPYIPSKAPPRPTYLPPTTVSYAPASFSPVKWSYNFTTGGQWTGQVGSFKFFPVSSRVKVSKIFSSTVHLPPKCDREAKIRETTEWHARSHHLFKLS